MNDYFYLKTGFISNYRNRAKKSFIVDARTLYFFSYRLFTATRQTFSFRPICLGSLIRARVFSPCHYQLNPPFW